ncbi:MAG: L-fucose/L-arabinose isomerase family protein, partial [Kiritimatiellia bacterium]
PGLAVQLGKPVICWSEPEPPMAGGRIAANSFCAVNMHAHALWKMRRPYLWVHGAPAEARPELARQFKVLSAIQTLRRARIGLLGGRVPGFYTSNYNELALLAAFGTEVEIVTLLELVKLTETVPDADRAAAVRQIQDSCVCEVSDAELLKGAALFVAFRKLTEKYRLDAWSVRCWPEFSELYGIGVCHILGCLTNSGVPVACEGDVYGALSMLMLKNLAGADTFFCDLISFDQAGDTGLFWHCGAAPLSLCRPGCRPALRRHSIIDGGDRKGIAAEFPLKSGPVTVVRISEQRDGGGFRLLSIHGEGLDTEQLLHGNPLQVRFRRPAADLAARLIESGFEHHYVLVHGDLSGELRIISRLLNLEYVAL